MPASPLKRAAVRRIWTASRHPRLSDYDSATHKYKSTYLTPESYGILVEDFPGMILREPRQDQQQRPGSGGHNAEDIWHLSIPAATTGWRFSIVGRQPTGLGPRRRQAPPFMKATIFRPLPSVAGTFHPERPDNPWKHRFTVPRQGTYEVTVERMEGTQVADTFSKTLHLREFLVVSIGDSAASGEGNPDVPGRPAGFDPDISWYDVIIPAVAVYKLSKEAYDWAKDEVNRLFPQIARKGSATIAMNPVPTWLEPRAHRSLRSSHAFAAKLCEDLNAGVVVTYLGFGRTGAGIDDGMLGPRGGKGPFDDHPFGNVGELDELVAAIGSRHIDALVMHAGANDVGVSSTLEDLVSGDNAITGSGDATANRLAVDKRAHDRIRDLPDKFNRLATGLARLDVGQIYLVEYPTSLFDDDEGVPQHGCELFDGPKLDLSKRDAELVKQVAHDLNLQLARIAQSHQWIFVTGVESDFKGHGYCRPQPDVETVETFLAGGDKAKRSWFVTCSLSLAHQGDTEGTVHPNQRGQEAIGRQIYSRINKFTIQPALAATPTQAGGAAAGAATGSATKRPALANRDGRP